MENGDILNMEWGQLRAFNLSDHNTFQKLSLCASHQPSKTCVSSWDQLTLESLRQEDSGKHSFSLNQVEIIQYI